MMAEKQKIKDGKFFAWKLKKNYVANKSKLESNWVWASGCDGSNNVDPIEMDPRNRIQPKWILQCGESSRYAIMLYWLVIDRFVRYQYR